MMLSLFTSWVYSKLYDHIDLMELLISGKHDLVVGNGLGLELTLSQVLNFLPN